MSEAYFELYYQPSVPGAPPPDFRKLGRHIAVAPPRDTSSRMILFVCLRMWLIFTCVCCLYVCLAVCQPVFYSYCLRRHVRPCVRLSLPSVRLFRFVLSSVRRSLFAGTVNHFSVCRWDILSVCMFACQFVCVRLTVCGDGALPVCWWRLFSLSACVSVCLCVCVSVCLCVSACLPACLPVCLSVCLSVCLARLSECLSVKDCDIIYIMLTCAVCKVQHLETDRG